MDWSKILIIIQVVTGALLVTSILLQSRGASLGDTFGGSGAFYGTRRGAERGLFFVTIALAVIFLALAFAVLFV